VPDLFISYSRRDGAFVKRLHGVLAEKGRDVWVDWEDIPPAWEWRDELQTGLEQSNTLVFVISPESLSSRECSVELERALEFGKRIVPVVVRDPDGGDVPEPLASRNWIFIREGQDDFEAGVQALESALDTDADWVRNHTRLLHRAGEWERSGRDRSRLLRGTDLREAETGLSEWREGVEPTPTALQREFVAAGRRASGRRMAALLAGTGVALALSVVLGVLAILARNDAVDREHEAKSRSLAVAGLLRVDSDPELATLLAMEAVRLDRTPEAEEALRRGVSSLQTRDIWRPKSLNDFDVAPDGRRVAAALRDGRVFVRDVGTGRVRLVDRHPGGAIARFAVNDDRITTSGGDGRFTIHDATGKRLRTLRTPNSLSAVLSDDGTRVVGMDDAGAVHSWDARTGRAAPRVQAPRGWKEFEASFDGRRVLAIYPNGRARVFDAVAGRRLGVRRIPAVDYSTADLSGDGRWVVSTASTDTIEIWDAATGRVARRLRHSGAGFSAVDVSRDGSLVATGGSDNRVRLWNGRTGAQLHELRGHGDSVTEVRLSRSGRRVLSVGLDRTARIWYTGTGEQDLVVRGTQSPIDEVRMTVDGRHVLTRARNGELRLIESSPGRALAVLQHRGPVQAATLHPSRFLVASSGPDRIQIADSLTGRVFGGDDASVLTVGDTHDMAFDPRGTRLAVADGAAAFVNNFQQEWRYRNHGDRVHTVSWSRDGRQLLTASKDGTARFLDPRDAAKETRPPLRHRGDVREALFTPDGRRVVTLECTATPADAECGTGTVRLWDPTSRRVLDSLTVKGGATDIEVSPDGRFVAVAAQGDSARLWRPLSRARPRELRHRYDVNAVRFSRDGRHLATASDDGTARVWDVPSGRPVAELGGHLDPVRDIDISPDGRFVLSASADRTVRLWDLRTRRVVGVFGGHDGPVLRARFSASGDQVLTVPEFGAAAVYACDACGSLNAVLTRAGNLVRRRLTPAERRTFLR
jgi:WD40 repeat protein